MGQRIRVTTIKPKDRSKVKGAIIIRNVQQGSSAPQQRIDIIRYPPGQTGDAHARMKKRALPKPATAPRAVVKRTTPNLAKKD